MPCKAEALQSFWGTESCFDGSLAAVKSLHLVALTSTSGRHHQVHHLVEAGADEHHRAEALGSPEAVAWKGPGADAGKSLDADTFESPVVDAQRNPAAGLDLSQHFAVRMLCTSEILTEVGHFRRALAWQRPCGNPCQPGAALGAGEPGGCVGAAAGAETRVEAHPEGH